MNGMRRLALTRCSTSSWSSQNCNPSVCADEKTTSLTYDVIASVTLDLRLHEQPKWRGDFMRAFYNLTPLAKFNSLKNQLERFTPKYRRMLATNSKVLRYAILPGTEKYEVSRSTLMLTLQFSTTILVKLGSHVVSLTESLVVALEHLQHHEKTLILWADAVCINQSDNVEKGYQVQMMSRIYKTAALVVAWLGPESEDSDKAIKQLRASRALAFSAMAQIDEIQNMFESGQLGQTEGDEPPRAQNIEFLPVKNLLERPWFDRIWVLQEAVLNDHTLFLAGQSFLEPDALFWGGNEWVSAHYGLAHVIDHTRWQRLTPINVPLELEVFFLSSISLSVFGPGLRCSDPKDYVYGLLGLIEDAERYGLRADYSLSLADIYTNFATALCPETDLALPSWVPDLRVAQFNTMDTWIDGEIYQADLATSNDKRFSDVQTSGDGTPRLIVGAYNLDTIESVLASLASDDPSPAEQAAFLGSVNDAMSHVDLPSHAATGEALLSAPAFLLAHLRSYFQPSRAELLKYLNSRSADASTEWAHLSPCRHLFLTKSGLVGLSHGPVSAGDNVFIIDHTRGQWVLRGLAQNGCYRIVSPGTVYPIHINGQWKSRREEIYLC
ncbi:heterokaryon incompatibility protein-domain-containing protein [Ustulina deusta]|nr:heterokaryon incompatibility protein-domain-containing protein [Ustulina deusta]